VKFIGGLILGLLIVPFGAYLYFTGGAAPVATTDSDMRSRITSRTRL